MNKLKQFVNLKRLGFLPSWIILFMDMGIVFFASVSSYFVFSTIGVQFYSTVPLLYRLLFYVTLLFFYFLLFKTYKGIIRYSSIKDAIRLFKAVFSTFITLLLVDTLYLIYSGQHIFVIFTIFLSSLVILFSLIFFRIAVKWLFKYLSVTDGSNSVENLAIIGVNSTTIALAEAFVNDSSTYNLCFFIDKNKYLNDKKILGIPVIAKSNSIIAILRFYKIKHVVLIKNYLPEEEEIAFLEACLENKIVVYNPKLVSGFDNSLNTTKSLKRYTLEELLYRETISIDNPNVINRLKGKTILVTGGAGSIGSEIVNQLAHFEPAKIVIVDQAETPLNTLQLNMSQAFPSLTCHYELITIGNREEVFSVFEHFQPEIVFHAAAYKHVPVLETNFRQAIKVNILGTKNVLEAAAAFGADRFVLISTDKAVNPTNIMGASKRIAEIMVQSYFHSQTSENKMKIITTRFGNVLGSNGSVVHLFEEQIKKGGPVTVTHPEINRFFMTIPEACKLVLEAGAMGSGGEIYIFDMGKPVLIRNLAEKMIRLSGKEPYTDIDIVFIGLRPGEKLYEEILADSSKTLPTYHPKILIAQDRVLSYELVTAFLAKIATVNFQDKASVIAAFQELVPEFIQTSKDC
ncbi:polysaccharide biosynthesis protein [Flavobacterium sp. HXWNR69]|uniref:Polysaccharide biosynthesis protein n=1 Tax=Flavobacterium fragile TaxID=2949085 RepID=A0ABT0TGL3_9FLAO|nr:nucleoside-diphosphate sugar epimerase/dehydratase [Flavobacterium sp. HXWNR69]MCL9769711.1 polysaccharide biosynthesis protein [Flavobacterium sp. HXWNR69]